MPAEGAVHVHVQAGGVAVITLDRPDRLNALSAVMMEQLATAYAACDADADVRVVVLTGAGRAFCSGADLQRTGGAFRGVADPDSFRSSPVRPAAFELCKPVVAAINGHAIGLGMTLALQCDLRLMADDAKWGVVQVRRGMVGDAHSHFTLVRAVGVARAAEILLGGTTFAATDALRLGVASRVLPADEVLDASLALANDMATNASPLSMALSKRILWASADGADAATIDEMERQAHLHLLGTSDAIEGGRAFVERRSPQFTSRVPDDLPLAAPGSSEAR
jgi:enoyl-CoA hydratase/carnithine racemase